MRVYPPALVLCLFLCLFPSVSRSAALHISAANLFWFTQDALNQLGTGRMGTGACLRAGPLFQAGANKRYFVFGEAQYQDYGRVTGTFVPRYDILVSYSSSPWLVFGGTGIALERALGPFLRAGVEFSAGMLHYSCPLLFDRPQHFEMPGMEPRDGSQVSFKGDTYYVQGGAGLTFRLWRSGPARASENGVDIPAEMLFKLRFNHCRGGRIECLQRDSFKVQPNQPLHFESQRTLLSQTHFRMALGFTL